MPAEEIENLAPAVHGLLGTVERAVPVEEAVAGAIVAVELVALALLLQLGLMLVHLLGAWRAVVVAENAEQGAGEVFGELDRRDGRLGVELLPVHHHPPAPKVGARRRPHPAAGSRRGTR